MTISSSQIAYENASPHPRNLGATDPQLVQQRFQALLAKPVPPVFSHGTGYAPAEWAKMLGLSIAQDLPTEALSRHGLRTYCRTPGVSAMHKYCAVMAWGEQGKRWRHNALNAFENAAAIEMLVLDLSRQTSRETAYECFLRAKIKGLGPSFGTKLLKFIPEATDMYIMDMHVARSVNFLYGINIVKLAPSPTWKNTAKDYAIYCRLIDDLAALTHAPNGEAMELHLFSPEWRAYVAQNSCRARHGHAYCARPEAFRWEEIRSVDLG